MASGPQAYPVVYDAPSGTLLYSYQSGYLPIPDPSFAFLTVQTLDATAAIFVGLGSTNTGLIEFFNSTNNNHINIQSGVTTSSYTLTLPVAQGAAGSVLTNNGSGVLSFAPAIPTVTADPVSPTEGQVWYNLTSHLLKYYDGSTVQTVAHV